MTHFNIFRSCFRQLQDMYGYNETLKRFGDLLDHLLPKSDLVISKAAKIAKSVSISEAIRFIESNATPDNHVVNLFKANLSSECDMTWAKHTNAYLSKFNIAPLSLKEGICERFFRISADSGYKVDNGAKVSIIMPVYNAEKTIYQAVYSILNQTWQNIELIICDDASSDGSWYAINNLASIDGRIKVLRNKINMGPYISKNLALRYVTGDYITGHDSDDWAHPQRIERQLTAMTDEPGVKVNLGYMLRVNQKAEFCRFAKINKISFDGAARLAFISAMFETATFKRMFGHWDCVRFGADSELIDRARKVLGGSFQTVKLITMFCLETESGLTNHPTHGIRANNGRLSKSRSFYRKQWSRWHQKLHEENAFLDFPQVQRKFAAPEEMLVDPATIKILESEN